MSKLLVAVKVYSSLVERHIQSRRAVGLLAEKDYKNLKKQLADNDLLLVFLDEKFSVEFELPADKDEFFGKNIDDLLEAGSRLLEPPASFYLAEEDFLYQGSTEKLPDHIKNYFDTALFASILLKLADHSIPKGRPKAIFLHGEKLELDLRYKSKDINRLRGLRDFIDEFVDSEIHNIQKITIIKLVLLEMLKNNDGDSLTLPCLLERFSEFTERVNANYQLYVSEFSFDKIKSQVEKEKFDFTLKLNGVFSDMQSQLLAVPIGLVLVGSQMKMTDGFSATNITLWLSVIIFGFFMSLLMRNQRSTLKAIKIEIDSQWIVIESRHRYVAERLGFHYKQLADRYRLQRWFLMLVSFIISGSIVGSTALLLHRSQAHESINEVLFFGVIGGMTYLLIFLIWKLGLKYYSRSKNKMRPKQSTSGPHS